MILVRRYRGESLSFRTARGMVRAKVQDGFMFVEVDPVTGRHMQVLHRFHRPPAKFSLAEKKKEVEPPPEKKKAPASKPKKKTTTRRRKKSSE